MVNQLSIESVSELLQQSRSLNVAADIYRSIVAAGSSFSTLASMIQSYGGRFENIWGGNLETTSGRIYTVASINYKDFNNSSQISDPSIRNHFIQIVRTYLLH